jgi:hypothetical protein
MEVDTHINSEPARKYSIWFKTGVVLLVINFPFGYGGLAACAAIAAYQPDKKALWGGMGIAAYIISWGMFGLGILMTGKEGLVLIKRWKQQIWNRIRGKQP